MTSLTMSLAGVLAGLLGFAPLGALLALALRGRRVRLGWGLAAVIGSLALLTCGVFAVRLCSRDLVLAFGASAGLSLAAATAATGVIAWRTFSRRQEEGK